MGLIVFVDSGIGAYPWRVAWVGNQKAAPADGILHNVWARPRSEVAGCGLFEGPRVQVKDAGHLGVVRAAEFVRSRDGGIMPLKRRK